MRREKRRGLPPNLGIDSRYAGSSRHTLALEMHMAPRARWLQVLGELCDVQSCVFSTDRKNDPPSIILRVCGVCGVCRVSAHWDTFDVSTPGWSLLQQSIESGVSKVTA